MTDGTERTPTISGFRIRARLGAGSAGTVYVAVQESLEREVALKVLVGFTGHDSGRRRFRREAQALANLSHPNLVRLFAYHDDPAQPWVALEYLPGGTLRERIRDETGAGRPLPVADVARLARDLFTALDVVHLAGLVHRDVKPANILYRANGDAVLGDLGLVRETAADATRLTRDGDLLGTLAYLAPECHEGAELSAATDLYAAGLSIYEALTGRHPTDVNAIKPGFRVTDPLKLRPDAPRELADLVADLLDPDPAKRPKSARAVLGRLEGRRAAATAPRVRPAPAYLSVVSSLAVGFLLAIALAVLFRKPPEAPPKLTVRAGTTAAVVRAPLARPDIMLAVFDAGGKVHQAYDGVVSGHDTTFRIDRLTPGATYRARLVPRKPDATVPAAEITFRTAVRLELLGVDTRDGLWIRTTPDAHARWAGAPGGAGTGREGGRLPLPPSGSTTPVLELLLDSGEKARVQVKLPARPPPPPLPIGVQMYRFKGDVTQDGVKKPLLDWLTALKPACISIHPRPDGGPNLALAESDALWKHGISTMYMVRTSAPPEAIPWRHDLDQLDHTAPGQVTLVVCPDWLGTRWEVDDRAKLLQTIAIWRDWLKRRAKPFPLLVPLPVPVTMRLLKDRPEELWMRAGLDLTAVEVLAGTDSILWGQLWDDLSPKVVTAGLKPAIRYAWVVRDARRDIGAEAIIERTSLVAGFLTARTRFAGATVLVHLDDLAWGLPRTVTKQAVEFERVVRRLAGLAYQRPLPMQASKHVSGTAFAGDGRRVQLAFSPRAGQARFRPARPGMLSTDGKSTPRIQLDTAPVELTLNDNSAIYEELMPVSGEPIDGIPVELAGEDR